MHSPRDKKWLHELPVGCSNHVVLRAQELCESRGGRPGLPSLVSLPFKVPENPCSTVDSAA